MKRTTLFALVPCVLVSLCRGEIIEAKAPGNPVPAEVMEEIYREVQTPCKVGVLLAPGKGKMLDNPSVFRFGNEWRMMYIMFDNSGYETYLAKSKDLLHWQVMGKVLPYGAKGAWDQCQSDGAPSLFTTEWGGANTLQPFSGKYWMTFIGGANPGYETPPLGIGMANSANPGDGSVWVRHPANPVLSIFQKDVRAFEAGTLFKPFVVWDKAETLGWPFVVFYNAKGEGGERIGMAVSKDMTNWQRYGREPVVQNVSPKGGFGISGDPMVTRLGNVWVMFYFGAFWKPANGNASDTFACSYDLATWTKWDGAPLVRPSESYDRQFAHKPWVIRVDGVTYHFYCAVGEKGRAIALATSKPMHLD